MSVEQLNPSERPSVPWNESILATLPTEVSSAILVESIGPPHKFRKIQDVLNLALVCKEWRDVVFSEPSMWRSFEFTIYGPHSVQKKAFATACRWYNRSGGLALALRLSLPSKPVNAKLHEFILSFDRWETISFLTDNTFNWVFDLLAAASEANKLKEISPLQNLRQFSVGKDDLGYTAFSGRIFGVFAGVAPELASIEVNAWEINSVSHVPAMLGLNKRLTRLKIHNFRSDGILLLTNLLSLLPDLQSLDLSAGRTRVTARPTTPTSVVEHHRLKTLKLTIHDNSLSLDMGWIQLPVLESLTLKSNTLRGIGSVAISNIKKLVFSCRKLQQMSLYSIGLETDDLFAILMVSQTLQSVRLMEIAHNNWKDGELFERLFQQSQVERVLPDLEEILIRHEVASLLVRSFTKFVEDPKRWPVAAAENGDGELTKKGCNDHRVEATGGYRRLHAVLYQGMFTAAAWDIGEELECAYSRGADPTDNQWYNTMG